MLGREQVANTYLGKGIAIPHGLPKDRDMILRTGIAVVQVPQGVEWNKGEIVYLVIAIAARSDEHIGILANLTNILDDDETIRTLSQTNNAGDILAVLTRARDGNVAPTEPSADFAKYFDITIRNATGLHARPATVFAGLAKQFDAEVRVRQGDRIVNGKSLASLLKLGAEAGSTIRVMAQGADADAALKALKEGITSGLGEQEEQAAAGSSFEPAYELAHAAADVVVPGIPGSPGIAIGPLNYLKRVKVVVEAVAKDPEQEKTQLTQAIETARVQLEDLYKEVKERSGEGRAAIFLAHIEFLDDPELRQDVVNQIDAGSTAGWAWRQAIDQRVAELRKVNDPVIAGRAIDLSDVGSRVLRLLAPVIEEEPATPQQPVILVAEDLTPSDTANLDPALILGFVTAGGGPTSHSAIIARALGIPAIVAAGPFVMHQPEGSQAILDGNRGNLYVSPTPETLAAAQQVQQAIETLREAEKLSRYQPALMTDGHRVEIVANVSKAGEAETAVNAGSEGIGLLRTEFLFLGRSQPPSEEEQFEAYREMVRALNGLPIVIRTLDVGGDKNVPYLSMPAEQNPFLGVRGIRLCLAQPDLFRTQLRAIYRAAEFGPVRMMFPMVSMLEELRAAKAIAEEVRAQLGAKPVEIGIMIEVPSAVLMADEFAQEVDFFSIGTNDLTQYTLAMDRLHPMLAKQADGLHPAVLRMVDRTVAAATAAGKWVGVCGGVAADPKGAAILVGLGVAELSVSIPSIAALKAQMRHLSYEKCIALAQQALGCCTAAEVRELPLS
jgi:phosphocarrier protein FPr